MDAPEKLEEYGNDLKINVLFIFLTMGTCLLSVWKIMNYLRLSTDFGQMVQLVGLCLSKLPTFMVFMSMWLIYFSLAYYILGNEIDGGDDFSMLAPPEVRNQFADLNEVGNEYSDLRLSFKYLIQAWRNAIGDLSAPEYPNWIELKKEIY